MFTYYNKMLKFVKLQACVAKGHPKEAIDNYRVTLSMDGFDEDKCQHDVDKSEPHFILLTVDQLLMQI
jgi:hypothetical protein